MGSFSRASTIPLQVVQVVRAIFCLPFGVSHKGKCFERLPGPACFPRQIKSNERDGDLLAQAGQLDLLKSGQGKEFSTQAMDLAAANGHLEVVKWLHENRTEGCT